MHLSDHLQERFPPLGMRSLFERRQFLALDSFLPDTIAAALARECENWHPQHPNPFGHFRNMRRFVEEAHSSSTLRWLSSATGIELSHGEPHLVNAGFAHSRQPWPCADNVIALDLHFAADAALDSHKRSSTAFNRCFVHVPQTDYTGVVQGLRLIYHRAAAR